MKEPPYANIFSWASIKSQFTHIHFQNPFEIKRAMHPIFTCILLLLSSSGTLSKYVHVDKKRYQDASLSYCRQYYTDLAPVNNERDIAELRKIKNNIGFILIGLERSSTYTNKWMWSGGGEVTRFFWASGPAPQDEVWSPTGERRESECLGGTWLRRETQFYLLLK